jgi:hypothetical protein
MKRKRVQQTVPLVISLQRARREGISRADAVKMMETSIQLAAEQEGWSPQLIEAQLTDGHRAVELVYGLLTEPCPACQRAVQLKRGLRVTHGPGPHGEFICPGSGDEGMVKAAQHLNVNQLKPKRGNP